MFTHVLKKMPIQERDKIEIERFKSVQWFSREMTEERRKKFYADHVPKYFSQADGVTELNLDF